MVAAIINRIRFRAAVLALLACVAGMFTSCVSKSPPLISDPTAAKETDLPWNQQQKWEREGQAAGLTEQRR
jgi:hypothetical protein